MSTGVSRGVTFRAIYDGNKKTHLTNDVMTRFCLLSQTTRKRKTDKSRTYTGLWFLGILKFDLSVSIEKHVCDRRSLLLYAVLALKR